MASDALTRAPSGKHEKHAFGIVGPAVCRREMEEALSAAQQQSTAAMQQLTCQHAAELSDKLTALQTEHQQQLAELTAGMQQEAAKAAAAAASEQRQALASLEQKHEAALAALQADRKAADASAESKVSVLVAGPAAAKSRAWL